jgi:hypothetical protein
VWVVAEAAELVVITGKGLPLVEQEVQAGPVQFQDII